jgi:protein-tyrosine phosphatase
MVMGSWVQWARKGVLARSPRPGFAPGAEFAVRREAVDAWIEEVRALGVVSIICLLDQDQLPLYERTLPGGLLARYAAAGFEVAHIPTPDGRTHPYTPQQLDAAWQAFQRLPKPVLVHCSAGVDRTGRIVTYLLRRLGG